jgi:hypothetical protein
MHKTDKVSLLASPRLAATYLNLRAKNPHRAIRAIHSIALMQAGEEMTPTQVRYPSCTVCFAKLV